MEHVPNDDDKRMGAAEEAEPGEVVTAPVPAIFPGGDETILVVEDNADIRLLLRELLTGVGYTVCEAEDGEEGVALLREHRDEVRLVILDVILPKMNGRETYEAMQEIKKETAVLFMSGYTDDILSRNGVLDGAYRFIAKPFTPRALLTKVRKVLDGEA